MEDWLILNKEWSKNVNALLINKQIPWVLIFEYNGNAHTKMIISFAWKQNVFRFKNSCVANQQIKPSLIPDS
jgi:hypothetical protein